MAGKDRKIKVVVSLPSDLSLANVDAIEVSVKQATETAGGIVEREQTVRVPVEALVEGWTDDKTMTMTADRTDFPEDGFQFVQSSDTVPEHQKSCPKHVWSERGSNSLVRQWTCAACGLILKKDCQKEAKWAR